ncbi:MAG: TetR/AcrR family transcriptional regulator [Parvibaculum sp.]
MPEVRNDAAAVDGRRVRGQENRRKIVEAMLALIGEGMISPSAEEVAARAEVGLRTVFRHFDDMDSLYREISALMSAELMPIATAPFPEGSWQDRIFDLVQRRGRVFEKMMPFKIAADVHRHRSDFLNEEHAEVIGMQRRTLQAALGGKSRLDPLKFEALNLVMSFDAWRHMRIDQKLSVAQVTKILMMSAEALLRDEPGWATK